MIRGLYSVLLRILPYQRIPRLPRGLLSGKFDEYSRDDERVLARLGARDPKGVKVAMRRAGVATVDELVATLEHQRPRREFQRRWNAFLCQLTNSHNYDPNEADFMRAWRDEERAKDPQNIEMKRRLDTVVRRLK